MSSILIVDDEETQRKALHDYLIKRDFTVLEAKNGVQGLEIALNQHPDVILLDVRMPVMDGMTMMLKLRQDKWGEKASVIILSNYDTDNTQIMQITEALPSYYLLKASSSLDLILEKIQETLDAKGKEKESDTQE